MHSSTSSIISARARVAGVIAVLSLAGSAGVARAQSASDSAAYGRAREMVANGDAAKGRRLADSVAATAPTGSAAFAEGLYWRALLAENARDSERYYRQIIVDYPLSGRVPDALLRIGQLESARGDNAAALQHFQRLVLEHPDSPMRPEASYWVAQMYFKANDPSRACSANADALASVRPSNVELKNRIDFAQQRCRGVALASAAPASKTGGAPVTVPVDKAPAQSESPKAVASARPETKAALKADSEAAARASAKASEKARAKARADSIATERALERVRAESLSLAKAAEAKAIAAAKAKTAADAKASTAARASSSRTDTGARTSGTSGNLGARPGAVTREPTREEVARALASADMPIAKSTAAKVLSSNAKAGTKTKAAASAHVKHKPAATAKAGAATGSYAVQIAAFGTREPADLLVAKMRGRGYDAYIDGRTAPYRVRLGHYTSHAAATAALARLKAKQIDGFVAER